MNMLYQEEKTQRSSAWQCFMQKEEKATKRILFLAQAYWQKWHLDKAKVEFLTNLLKGEATILPFSKKNNTVLNISLAPAMGADNTYNKVLAIAISLVMSTLKVPVILKGDFGYGFEVGLSDIMQALNLPLAYKREEFEENFQALNFAYVHLPQVYPTLENWKNAREDFAQGSIFEQVFPLLPVLEKGQNIYNLIACADWQQVRFFAQFFNFEKGEGVQKTALLHDSTNTAFLSLCSDFYWQTSNDIEVMYLKDWNLPQLKNNCLQQAEKIQNAAQGAEIVRHLLQGKMGEDWQTILLVNVAFLLQTMQPQGDIMRALLDAEAALESQRAYKFLESLEAKNKKDI